MNFLFLDVSTSEVHQQMTIYWENVGYLLEYEKIKKNIFELLENEKIEKWIFELLEKEKIKKWIIEFLIFRCFHLGGSSTNDNILRKCWVFIGIWKNQKMNFWIIGKWKN